MKLIIDEYGRESKDKTLFNQLTKIQTI